MFSCIFPVYFYDIFSTSSYINWYYVHVMNIRYTYMYVYIACIVFPFFGWHFWWTSSRTALNQAQQETAPPREHCLIDSVSKCRSLDVVGVARTVRSLTLNKERSFLTHSPCFHLTSSQNRASARRLNSCSRPGGADNAAPQILSAQNHFLSRTFPQIKETFFILSFVKVC